MKFQFAAPKSKSRSLLLFGCAILLFGLYQCEETARFILRSEKTTGEIVRVEKFRGNRGSSFYPVFSFHDKNGQQWEGRTPYSSNIFSSYHPHQVVTIVYDPDKPSKSNIYSVMTTWALPGFFVVLGSLFMIVDRFTN